MCKHLALRLPCNEDRDVGRSHGLAGLHGSGGSSRMKAEEGQTQWPDTQGHFRGLLSTLMPSAQSVLDRPFGGRKVVGLSKRSARFSVKGQVWRPLRVSNVYSFCFCNLRNEEKPLLACGRTKNGFGPVAMVLRPLLRQTVEVPSHAVLRNVGLSSRAVGSAGVVRGLQ